MGRVIGDCAVLYSSVRTRENFRYDVTGYDRNGRAGVDSLGRIASRSCRRPSPDSLPLGPDSGSQFLLRTHVLVYVQRSLCGVGERASTASGGMPVAPVGVVPRAYAD